MFKWILTISILFFSNCKSFCQDYGWWNELVSWDGKTSWQEYLELSPRGLGPNALPVPEFHLQEIGNYVIFKLNFQNHLRVGESTRNLFTSIEIPFNNQISVKAWIVPLEYYDTSTNLRDERKIRQFEAKGFGIGDLYFGTFVTILKEKNKTPFILFSANLKTASGNNIEGGRVTETPGYYFDLLLAKNFKLSENFTIRPYFAGGLYVYQTYDGYHFQNDAVLYGTGLSLTSDKHYAKAEINGYSGYLDIGDQPIILRISYERMLNQKFKIMIGFQNGLRHFKYTTLQTGFSYSLDKEKITKKQ